MRWYITYRSSYRDLQAMMTERGIVVSHGLKPLSGRDTGPLLPLFTAGCNHHASQPAVRRIGVEARVPHL